MPAKTKMDCLKSHTVDSITMHLRDLYTLTDMLLVGTAKDDLETPRLMLVLLLAVSHSVCMIPKKVYYDTQ